MEIQWVNGQYAEDNRIFDMETEVYEWADSLYGDFLDGLVNKKSVGYATPDEKVITPTPLTIDFASDAFAERDNRPKR